MNDHNRIVYVGMADEPKEAFAKGIRHIMLLRHWPCSRGKAYLCEFPHILNDTKIRFQSQGKGYHLEINKNLKIYVKADDGGEVPDPLISHIRDYILARGESWGGASSAALLYKGQVETNKTYHRVDKVAPGTRAY